MISLQMHQPTFFARPLPRTSNRKSLGFPTFPIKTEECRKMPLRLVAPPRAASISGPGSEYTEQLLGTEKKQRRQSVAGVDQDELVDPISLADHDSCFCEFNGLQIHHKVCEVEDQTDHSAQNETSSQLSNRIKKIGFPIILLHGFGASVFSWHLVMKPLAQVAGAKVLAFDRPAFGLTSRVSSFERPRSSADDAAPLNPYSTAFSVLATLFFIDFLSAEKAILIGHSAGCLVAVNAYFEAPERVAALILVAPAIFASLLSSNASRQNQTAEENKRADGISNPRIEEDLFSKFWKMLSKFFIYVMRVVLQMVKGMMDMISSLYKKALSAILQSRIALMLVRMIMDKFGILAVRNAFCDSKKVTNHVIHGYTKPLKVRDWDKALLEYTLALLTENGSKSKTPLSRRLTDISCPVLIITGDRDRIVPAWNAERLSKAVPSSYLEVIRNCGHMPHEEKVEEFLSAVDKFLQRVFGAPEQQLLQATV